jgi:hypothetical protein
MNKKENIQQVLRNIEQMLTSMNYVSVTLVVHDDQIVQIERSEIIRLNKA